MSVFDNSSITRTFQMKWNESCIPDLNYMNKFRFQILRIIKEAYHESCIDYAEMNGVFNIFKEENK